MTPVLVELPDEAADALHRIAARNGLDVSEYVRRVIDQQVRREEGAGGGQERNLGRS